MACDAVAIALADDESARLRLMHHSGFTDDADALERRLTPSWVEALSASEIVTHTRPDGIEITGARLDNGLLSIDLVRPHAEPRMRTIRIDSGKEPEAVNTIDITARRSGSR